MKASATGLNTSMVKFDLQGGIIRGARSYQQDWITHLTSPDGVSAVAILCDGVGSGGYGNIASKTVAEACARALAPVVETLSGTDVQLPDLLRETGEIANTALATRIEENPNTVGMSTTLIIAVFSAGYIHWYSVGDSHLGLYRNKKLSRLNADHSLASGLDDMVKIGAIDAETARASGKSSVLTSAIAGHKLEEIDCPSQGAQLHPGDIVFLCSDGVETLSPAQIEDICGAPPRQRPAQLCRRLLDAIEDQNAPNQDNASMIVAMCHGDRQ